MTTRKKEQESTKTRKKEQKSIQTRRAIEVSLGEATGTKLYFEYIASKGLEGLQQEILGKLKCSDCGWCCSSCNVLLSEDDIIMLCKHLGCNFDQFYEKYMDKDTIMNYLAFPCPFLDVSKEKEKCIIYEARPKVCRHFPFNASLLTVDPCSIGKNILDLIENNISTKMPAKMSKKDLEELEEKVKRDEEKAKDTMAVYDELEAFLPQFNQVYGHLIAVIDKSLLNKIDKELKKGEIDK